MSIADREFRAAHGIGVGLIVLMSSWGYARDLVAPYIEKDSCPFECCQFGRWTSDSDKEMELVAAPGNPKIVGKIPPHVTVTAMTGERHITPQKKVIEADGDGFKKGDVVYLTGHIAECGMGYLWFRNGKEIVGGRCGEGSPAGCVGPWACLDEWHLKGMKNPTVWWVKIRLDSGIEGWIRNPDQFRGMSACGG